MAKKKQTLDMSDDDAAVDGFVIDFSDIEDFKPVDEGIYEAEIIQAEGAVSKAGFPKISMQWRITEGENENRRIFHDLSFHPKAMFATKAVLMGLGFDDTFKGNVVPEELIGLNAIITVSVESSGAINPQTNEPYPPRNNVKRVQQSGASISDML